MYDTKEEALKDGVPESDIAEVVWPEKIDNKTVPKLEFSKNVFKIFKNDVLK
jgi:hypothetical protein